jgi:hypothetical protein
MGAEPKTAYSYNPAAWQWWLGQIVKVMSIVGGIWLGISWAAGHVFDERLQQFHTIAKPEIRELIKDEVADHAAQPAHGDVLTRLRDVERENAGEAAELGSVNRRLDRIESKLDILIRNGNHGTTQSK